MPKLGENHPKDFSVGRLKGWGHLHPTRHTSADFKAHLALAG